MKFSVPLKENHKALWNWLAKNPDKKKEDWPGWETISKLDISLPLMVIENRCFACGEAGKATRNTWVDVFCRNCPCDWGKMENVPYCEHSFYLQWRWETRSKRRSYLAQDIADAWR